MKQCYYVIALFVLSMGLTSAQSITLDDYNRAVSFMPNNLNNKLVFNLHTEANWFKDQSGLWFIDYSKQNKIYKTLSFSDNTVKPLFDHNKLAAALSTVLEKEVTNNAISISNIERSAEGNLIFSIAKKTYILDVASYTLQLKEDEKKEEDQDHESTSPDGKWLAFTKDYNLHITSKDDGKVYQLSTDGTKGYEHATRYDWFDIMEGENGERSQRFSVKWSADSKWLAAPILDTRTAEKMYLLDYSIDSLYKPKLLSYYRGSPGDTTMVHLTPAFYNIETKTAVKTNLPRTTHINSVRIEWLKASGQLVANYAERGYKKEIVTHVNLKTGEEQILIEETSATNIDNFWYKTLEEQQKIIFLSERSGWRQLYMVDLKTNKTKALTNGNYYINSVAHVDDLGETIYFLASGKEANNNPYHQQLYKTNFKGEITLLTPELLHHDISFSKDGNYFVDNYSSITVPTTSVLRTAKTGKTVANLTQADVSEALSKGWEVPEIFKLTAKDGKTMIYGALWKPTNFDASKSYPIIDHSYTGPHTQVFPKTFNRGFINQSLAELGFVVMMVDGLGTSGRSKAFHDHSYKNMGNNLEDHVLAINYLAEQHAWINKDKVGIFGHSAGGYDTGRAMLGFPEVYKVGVASSADHDFRMEKAWWPEMYQGWPVDSTYQNVSNITNAKYLEGKLLLVHGSLDDNVNPSATFKLAEALIKADKDFDLLILPSQRHGYQGYSRNYFTKKRWNYFIEHLLGVDPIWDFKWE